MQPALILGPAGVGVEQEGPVRRQPKRAGDGAALGFPRLGLDRQALANAIVEPGRQAVADVQEALGVYGAGEAAIALGVQGAAQVEQTPRPAEGRVALETKSGVDDRHRHRRRRRRRRRRPEDRLTIEMQTADLGVFDLDPAADEFGWAPVDVDIVGFQPDPLGIGDRQLADAEGAPKVPTQALHVQSAQPPERNAFQAAGDKVSPHRRHRPVAHHRPEAEQEPAEGDHDPQRDVMRLEHGRFRGPCVAQKLCPMLI